MKPIIFSSKLAVILISALLSWSVAAQNTELTPDYPERYTVVEGDTLWDIAQKFLVDPWRWAEVWQSNPQVENPDLIYPGDVLVMTLVDGKPTIKSLRSESVGAGGGTVRLSPKVRATKFRNAIPPIDPSAIQPYLNAPLVTDENELKDAGYIVDGISGRLLMGKYDQFYALGIDDLQASEYRVFRPGRRFIDPITRERLGFEAEHVGDARMLQAGEVSRLTLLGTHTDVSINDRLRPVYKKEALPFFYPKAPNDETLRGAILPTHTELTEFGSLSVVAINLGKRDKVEPGDVFRIKSARLEKRDPVTGKRFIIPEEKVGLLLVFRTFEKVSYALVTNSTRSISANDVVVSPDAD